MNYHFFSGEQNDSEFLKKNPFKKVPLIIDDGFILAESVAIMRYIAIKYNIPDHWLPRKDLQQAAKIDEFLHWQHLNIRKNELQIFTETFRTRIGVGERFPKKALDEKVVAALKEELTKSINHIADYYLKDQPYICGDEISAADLIGVCELIQLSCVNESKMYETNATVKAWIKRVGDRMAPYFEEANIKMAGLTKMFNNAATPEEPPK